MTDQPVGALTLEVTQATGRLAGSAEAAAALESLGVGDERARRLGLSNVFRLAAEVADLQDRLAQAFDARRAVERRRREKRAARHEASGRHSGRRTTPTAVPIAGAVLAIALLTGPLWTRDQAAERAVATPLAVAASICVTTGFVLATAVAGARHRGDPRLAWRAPLRTTAAGAVVAALAGLGLWALLSWRSFVAPPEPGGVLLTFAMLSALWLAAGLLFATGRATWVALSFAAGAGVGLAFRTVGRAAPETAHAAGIATALVIAAVAAWACARRDRRSAGRRVGDEGALARVTDGTAPGAVPLALFGAAIAGLFFADRAVAWSSHVPLHSWVLHPAVEAGRDWAVAAVVAAVVVVAVAARRFGPSTAALAERLPLTARRELAVEVRGGYRRAVVLLIVAGAAGAALSFVGVLILTAVSSSVAAVVRRETAYVFAVVGSGLALLAWALFNSTILLGFRRTGAPLLGAWLGLAVDVAVALLFAAGEPPWTSSFGLLAGAAVCWVVTTIGVRRVLRDPDVALATR
jgi:hypothetical protein